MDQKLKRQILTLHEQIKIKSDPWFDNPCGWLTKPSYSKDTNWAAMLKDKLSSKVVFKLRWFVFDKQNQSLNYYKSDTSKSIHGSINLSFIFSIQVSLVEYAPEFALDLISRDQIYSIATESFDDLVRWGFVIAKHSNAWAPLTANSLSLEETEISSEIENNETVEVDTLKSSHLSKLNKVDFFDINSTSRWFRYNCLYQRPTALMMTVLEAGPPASFPDNELEFNLPIGSPWLTVTAFESYPDHTPGIAEKKGIYLNDYLVGVNQKDLLGCNVGEATVLLHNAEWPKTLHFMRDKRLKLMSNRLDCWAYVSLKKGPKLRRYVQLGCEDMRIKLADSERRTSAIGQPSGDNAFGSAADALNPSGCVCLPLSRIVALVPVQDLNLPQDQQYYVCCLSLSHISDAREQEEVATSDAQDEEADKVAAVQLHFPSQMLLAAWCGALFKLCSSLDAAYGEGESGSTISLIDYQDDVFSIPCGRIAIKSPYTDRFEPRRFSIKDGVLHWERLSDCSVVSPAAHLHGEVNFSVRLEGAIPIANTSCCYLSKVYVVETLPGCDEEYKYQIVLVAAERQTLLGLKDRETAAAWLAILRRIVERAPEDSRACVPVGVDEPRSLRKGTVGSRQDADAASQPSTSTPSTLATILQMSITHPSIRKNATSFNYTPIEGYLIRRSEFAAADATPASRFRMKLQNGLASRTWCVLADHVLSIFRQRPRDDGTDQPPIGQVDVFNLTGIRDHVSEGNSFELVDAWRTVTLTADSTRDRQRWLAALVSIAEAHCYSQRVAEAGRQERLETIMQSVLYFGPLRRLVQVTGQAQAVWLERFFVLKQDALYHYATREQAFALDGGEQLGELLLTGISHLETCSMAEGPSQGRGFLLHAYIRNGADEHFAAGMRALRFEAPAVATCVQWLAHLCRASKVMRLVVNPDAAYQPGYRSEYGDFSDEDFNRLIQQPYEALSPPVLETIKESEPSPPSSAASKRGMRQVLRRCSRALMQPLDNDGLEPLSPEGSEDSPSSTSTPLRRPSHELRRPSILERVQADLQRKRALGGGESRRRLMGPNSPIAPNSPMAANSPLGRSAAAESEESAESVAEPEPQKRYYSEKTIFENEISSGICDWDG